MVVAGCLDEPRCPDGLVPVDDRCLPTACAACDQDLPFCDLAAETCVACREDGDCPDAEAPFCAGSPRGCVSCRNDDDCPEPGARFCVEGRCGGCVADVQCADDPAGPHCLTVIGDCAMCRPGVEEDVCGGFSCDGRTGSCTDTPLGSVDSCGGCRSDGECARDGDRCVPLRFQGDPIGAFCLAPADEGSDPPCPPPFFPTDDRTSLSGFPARSYCGPDEARTTCPALGDAFSVDCGADEDCGVAELDDGVCVLNLDRCSVPCVDDDGCPPDVSTRCVDRVCR